MRKIDHTKYKKDISYLWTYKNKTTYEIMEMLDVSESVVRRVSKIYDLKRCYTDKKWLVKKHYDEGLNTKEMAIEANCSFYSIRDWMNNHGLEICMEIANDSKKKYTFNHDYFEKIDSETKAYWLGFFVADGSLSSSSNAFDLSLARRDKKHLTFFLNEINSNYMIKDYETYLKETGKSYPMSRITITSKRFYDHLVDKNMSPKKSNNEGIPNIESVWYKDFIRGYFDGDGSIYYAKRDRIRNYKWQDTREVKLSASSTILGGKEFLCWVSTQIYNNIGLKPNVLKKSDSNVHIISMSDGTMKKFLDWVYEDSTIHLERKYLIYKEYLELYNTRNEWELKEIVRTFEKSKESGRNDLIS